MLARFLIHYLYIYPYLGPSKDKCYAHCEEKETKFEGSKAICLDFSQGVRRRSNNLILPPPSEILFSGIC